MWHARQTAKSLKEIEAFKINDISKVRRCIAMLQNFYPVLIFTGSRCFLLLCGLVVRLEVYKEVDLTEEILSTNGALKKLFSGFVVLLFTLFNTFSDVFGILVLSL